MLARMGEWRMNGLLPFVLSDYDLAYDFLVLSSFYPFQTMCSMSEYIELILIKYEYSRNTVNSY